MCKVVQLFVEHKYRTTSKIEYSDHIEKQEVNSYLKNKRKFLEVVVLVVELEEVRMDLPGNGSPGRKNNMIQNIKTVSF